MGKLQVPTYSLTDKLTQEQLHLFDKNGLIVFRNFIDREKVNLYISEIQRLEREWLEQGLEKINGIPLKFGKDEHGNRTIQRMCFASLHSSHLQSLLSEPRLQTLLNLVHPYEGRIGENEKDGLVVNNYIHTP